MRITQLIRGTGFLSFLLSLSTACSVVPITTQAPEKVAPLNIQNKEFSASEKILCGFDACDTKQAWCPGDQVLYGLEISEGSKKTLRYIRVQLPAECKSEESSEKKFVKQVVEASFKTEDGRCFRYSTEKMELQVELFDENGKSLGVNQSKACEEFLKTGLLTGCETGLKLKCAMDEAQAKGKTFSSSQVSDEDAEKTVKAILSLSAFLQIAAENPLLMPLIKSVVSKPSFFSLLFNMGAEMTAQVHTELSEEIKYPLPGSEKTLRAFRAPFEIFLNGSVALKCNVTVCDPKPPYQISSGILALDGIHPDNPEKHIGIRLLAARRGVR